jgi:hypothetical protein
MTASDGGVAHYVFRVRFRLDPSPPGVTVDPAGFETTLRRRADPPGEEGWLFFRDNLWRGEVNAPDHVRELTEEALGVPVESVTFSELRTDDAYLAALEEAVAANLDVFRADDVTEVTHKYFGSSIRVLDGEEPH